MLLSLDLAVEAFKANNGGCNVANSAREKSGNEFSYLYVKIQSRRSLRNQSQSQDLSNRTQSHSAP